MVMQQLLVSGVSIFFAFCLAYSGAVEAAYIIRLANGNELITGRYWQAGRQVMFDTYGGVFGIERSFVSAIEESNKPVRPVSVIEDSGETRPPVPIKEEEKEPKKKLSPVGQKVGAQRHEDPILRNFDVLKKQVDGMNGMLTPELQEFSKSLTELKRKIQLSGQSNDYLHEFAEISEMGDKVETALKSRR